MRNRSEDVRHFSYKLMSGEECIPCPFCRKLQTCENIVSHSEHCHNLIIRQQILELGLPDDICSLFTNLPEINLSAPTRIRNNLFLTNCSVAYNFQYLEENNISIVVNCADDVKTPKEYQEMNIQ